MKLLTVLTLGGAARQSAVVIDSWRPRGRDLRFRVTDAGVSAPYLKQSMIQLVFEGPGARGKKDALITLLKLAASRV